MLEDLLARRRCLLTLPAALAAAAGSRADTSAPTRLRILCIAGAGGTPDLIARAYAEGLERHYRDGVIVENRPGGAGAVAVAALKQSAADGSTALLAHAGVLTVNPHLFARLAYDAASDLSATSLAADTSFALAVGARVPEAVRTLDGFIAWARANPAACSHGSPGIGTQPHLLGAMLFRAIGVAATHVTYANGPQAIGDVIGARLACALLPEGLLRAHASGGRLRLLATSAETRTSHLPEVPTFAEQGLPSLVASEWFGFFLPAAAPAEAIDRLSAQLRGVAEHEPHRQRLAQLALRTRSSTPAAMRQLVAAESRQWKELIQSLGLRIE